MKRVVAGIDLRTWLVAGALLLDLLVLRWQIISSIGSAVCMARANFEAISCIAPPAEWQIALSGALGLALAITLGARLASMHRRIA
jgi:hypothetical protein